QPDWSHETPTPPYRAAPPPEPEPVAFEPDEPYGGGHPAPEPDPMPANDDPGASEGLYNYETEPGPPIEFQGSSPYVSYDEPAAGVPDDYSYVTFDDPPSPSAPSSPAVASVTASPEVDPSWLVLHAGTAEEQTMRLETDVTVGRGRACTVRVKDSRASRQHCRLFYRQDAWWLEDLGSANGTLVNGDFVAPEMPHRLHPGDLIVVGSVTLRYESDTDQAQFAL
ncbi:MAG: FHA domain-containing protein, partial [Myxococcota bacterium]